MLRSVRVDPSSTPTSTRQRHRKTGCPQLKQAPTSRSLGSNLDKLAGCGDSTAGSKNPTEEKQLQMKRPRLLVLLALVVVMVMVIMWPKTKQLHFTLGWASRHNPGSDKLKGVNLPVTRDVRVHEPWPEVEAPQGRPRLAYDTVYWLWCSGDSNVLEFRHYLSLLSAVRVLHPITLVMYYNKMPATDTYHSWLEEMKYSLPNLEFREFSSVACEGEKLRTLALGILSKTGGVLMGASTILTRHPDLVEPVQTFLLKDENAGFRGLVIADGPFKVEGKITKLVKNNEKSLCQKFDNFEINLADCLIVDKAVFPRDIVVAGTPFAEFARWLFYGRRKAMIVEREESPIPRVTHYVRFQGSRYAKELSFQHYLSVLSALHVAGFTQVFVHGDAEPTGPLWGDLKRENVTFVRLQKPKFVFQNKIEVVEHASDISRYLLLYKFGGVYQDWDVLWVQRFPDSLLSYPAVIGVDMFNYSWPDSLNNGVLAAHARSHFLHHFLATHREYFDTDWGRNSLQMSYRTWELYPMTVVIDRHLHVMCWFPKCYPTWMPGHTGPWTLKDTLSVHVPLPKPPASLLSPQRVKNSADLLAQIAKLVLKASGRERVLA